MQSDCIGRERLGYGGDLMTSAEAAMYMFDVRKAPEWALSHRKC